MTRSENDKTIFRFSISFKFFLLFSSLISVTTILIIFLINDIVHNDLKNAYLHRYTSHSEIVAKSFIEIDKISDALAESALNYLFQIDQKKLYSNDELNRIASSLGVKAFYMTDNEGDFIRSSDIPLSLQKQSLFSFCSNYTNLLNDENRVERTPILLGSLDAKAQKFFMRANHDKTRILESSVSLDTDFAVSTS